MSQLEAIMPISIKEKVRRHADRAIMSFESLNLFWRGEAPLILHIVTPDDELEHIRGAFARAEALTNVQLVFRSESEISPVFGEFPGEGTAKQMIIKLAAFMFVQAPFYLTLDTDIVACKPFGPEALIKDGLAVKDDVVPSMHNWWQASGHILGIEPQLNRPRMFVTPQLLSVDICRQLAEYLTGRFSGQDWMAGLLNRWTDPDIWTEYTLYDLFADEKGLYPKYYRLSEPNDLLQSTENGIWYAGQFADWSPERAINGESPGYFLVLQSITASELDFELIRLRWIEALSKSHAVKDAI